MMMFVSIARAAETGAEGAAAAAFYQAPEFWVAIAFLMFVALTARVGWRVITGALDKRIEGIRAAIAEAENLREEAQEMLAGFTRRQADAAKQIEDIMVQAREEAQLMRERLTREMEAVLERRQHLAERRIAQAEADAVDDVRRATADIALAATAALIVRAVDGAKGGELVDAAIAELPEKLN